MNQPDAPSRIIRKNVLSRFGIAIGTLIGVFALFASQYNVNKYSISPGGTYPVNNVVKIDSNDVRHLNTEIDMVWVNETYLTLLQYILDKFRSNVQIYPATEISGSATGKVIPEASLVQQNYWLQTYSQLAAKYAALSESKFKVSQDQVGIKIGWVDPTAPAYKKLQAGDFIVAINNQPTLNLNQLEAAVSKLKPGLEANIEIRRNQKLINVVLKPAKVAGTQDSPYLGVGILPTYKFPFPISINSTVDGQALGGPSAGLAYGLFILESLNPNFPNKSIKIAATGTLSMDGKVGPIGGLSEKTIAVIQSGAKIFFVPASQGKTDINKIRKIAGNRVKIVPVSTLSQAANYLDSYEQGSFN